MLDAGLLLVEQVRGLVFLVEQDAEKLNPLDAPECFGLARRLFGEHDEPELLQLFLHIGRVVDHGVLDGERAARGRYSLVVGRAVLAAVGDRPTFERAFEAPDRAIVGLRARHEDIVVRIQRVDQAHRRRRHEVHLVGGAPYDRDVGAQSVRYLRILRHHEEALPVRNADKPQAAFELVDSEVLGVFKLKRPRRLPAAAQISVVEVSRGA